MVVAIPKQKGFAPIFLVLILAALVIGGASFFYFTQYYLPNNSLEIAPKNLAGLNSKVTSPEANGITNTEKDEVMLSASKDAKMPDDFPSDIPTYPGGKLVSVVRSNTALPRTIVAFEYEGDLVAQINSLYKENYMVFLQKQIGSRVDYKNGKTILMFKYSSR